MAFSVPILLLTFKRLDTTKKVFESIKRIKPLKLYISSDGARPSKNGEEEAVVAVRNFLLNEINWECEVRTLFQEENLGCKYAVSGAMKWFFEHEEMGIILEDDCLPNQSFYSFCEELLEKYKDDPRIGMISGRNGLGSYQYGRDKKPYFFSSRGLIWGWATWRRVFNEFDVELGQRQKKIRPFQLMKASRSAIEYLYRAKNIRNLKQKKVDSWAYPWNISLLLSRKLAVIPSKNMVRNLGFGEGATHNFGDGQDDIPTYEYEGPYFREQKIESDNHFVRKTIIEENGGLIRFLITHISVLNKMRLLITKYV